MILLNRKGYRTVKRYLPGLCAALLLFCGGCARLSPAQGPGAEPGAGDGRSVEWEMHIAEETLQIPGFEGEYDILFLTDTHAVIRAESDSPQEAAEGDARMAEFRNAEGVSAARQLEDWIAYANEQKVDAVLLGGDIIDYPSTGNLDFLEEQLGRLEMPYLYTPGNHDWTYPWEYMTEYGRETYLPMLNPYMEENTAIHTWETDDLLIVAVDNSPGQVDHGAMERYEELLDTDKPVIVLVHVPFLTQSVLARAREEWDSGVVIGGGNYGGIYENDDSERFVKLTTAEDSPVELMLAGHVHFYDRDYIDGKKQILQVVGDAGYHGSAVRLRICGQ